MAIEIHGEQAYEVYSKSKDGLIIKYSVESIKQIDDKTIIEIDNPTL